VAKQRRTAPAPRESIIVDGRGRFSAACPERQPSRPRRAGTKGSPTTGSPLPRWPIRRPWRSTAGDRIVAASRTWRRRSPCPAWPRIGAQGNPPILGALPPTRAEPSPASL